MSNYSRDLDSKNYSKNYDYGENYPEHSREGEPQYNLDSTEFSEPENFDADSPIPIEDYNLLTAKVKENVKASAKVAYQISKAKKTLKNLERLNDNFIQEIHFLDTGYKIYEDSESESEFSDINTNTNNNGGIKGNYKAQGNSNNNNDQGGAPAKRSRRDITQVRRVQPIPRDENGDYILPVQIGILTVLSLGTIVTDNPNYHNDRYIWPIGYKIQRYYNSTTNPETQACYTASVVESPEGPKFVIEADDRPDDPIIGNTATGAWTAVVRMSNKIRNRNHSNSASGPDYYGFAHPTIAKMIQDLPGANLCKGYIWQEFEVMPLRSVPQRRYVVPPIPNSFNQDSQTNTEPNNDRDGDEGDNIKSEDSEQHQYIVSSPKYSDDLPKPKSKPGRGSSDLNLLLNNSDTE